MKYKNLRFLRVVVAAFVLLALTTFFLDFDDKIPSSTVWLAKFQFFPAFLAGSFAVFAALVAATYLFGRLYCSVVCPLGIFQDLIAWFGRRFAGISARRAAKKEQKAALTAQNAKPRPKRRVGRNYAYRENAPRVRLAFLALALLSFPFGGAYLALLEPYGIFGRIAVNVFKPFYVLFNNALYAICSKFDNYSFYYVDLRPESWGALIVGVASFVILIAFASRYGRLYCNTICPVGTILGLISKYSLFKVKINANRCVGCGLCAKACKSSCVDVANRQIDASRCVVCFDCFGSCRKNAISFVPGKKATLAVPNAPESGAVETQTAAKHAASSATSAEIARAQRAAANFDRGKREFLTLAALASTAVVARAAFGDSPSSETPAETDAAASESAAETAPLETSATAPEAAPADYGLTPFKREHTISPPGSVSHKRFQNRCVGCHLCVAKCPARVLKPSGFENGLRGFMQPRVEFSHGFCNFDCVICGEVCPAGAILPLTMEEKHLTQTGTVVFIKENCIVTARNESCGACAEHCPTQAVTMVPYGENGLTIPETNVELCVGCGGCEYICPARPFRAIYVEGHVVHQKAKPVEKEEKQEVENLDFGF